MKYLRNIALGILALGVVGCAQIGAVVTAPILGLGAKDAETTLTWIDLQEMAGTISPEDAVIAKQCPDAVIALNNLRESLKPLPDASESFRGVIYYGTRSRFGQGPEDLVKQHLTDVVNSCVHLVPSEKIVDALF